MDQGDFYTKCRYFIENKDPTACLEKALQLLNHEVTAEYKERQLNAVKYYLINSKQGFLVKNLQNVMELLEKLLTKINDEDFLVMFKDLLQTCKFPPILTKTSEILTFSEDIEEYFSMLGYIVVWIPADKQDLKLLLLSSIDELISRNYPEKLYYLTRVKRGEKCVESNLTHIFSQLLQIYDNEVYYSITKILLQLISVDATRTCEMLHKNQALSYFLMHLESTWKYRFPNRKPAVPSREDIIPYYTETVAILHHLLRYLPENNPTWIKPPTMFALWSLQYAFRLHVLKANAVERNNLMHCIVTLLEYFPTLFSGDATLGHDIAVLFVHSEIHFKTNWLYGVKFTANNDDFRFVSMLLIALTYFGNFVSGPQILEECQVMHGIIKLLKKQQSIKWNETQYCELLYLVLHVLHPLLPIIVEDFVEFGGTYSLLELIKKTKRNIDSPHILTRCLALLDQECSKYQIVRESAWFHGGIYIILPICENIVQAPAMTKSSHDCLYSALHLLMQLCRSADEVYATTQMVMTFLKRVINPKEEDVVMDPMIIVLFLTYIWNKMLQHDRNVREFIRMGGVYLLLDIVEMGNCPVQLVGLGTLVDLCDVGECIPYLITWRRNGKKIVSLLLDIFQTANERIGTPVGPCGEIKDPLKPLMGMAQHLETSCKCDSRIGNPTILDLIASVRPKVYCVLQILQQRQKDQVEISDEVYKMFNEDLSLRQKVTLVLAENFLVLKLGECWMEVGLNLRKVGCQPLDADKVMLDTLTEISLRWGLHLKRLQMDVLSKEMQNDLHEEHKLYRDLRESQLHDSLNALDEIDYISRCSESMFRIVTKTIINEQISKSLKMIDVRGNVHKTYMKNMPINPLFNQNIEVQSITLIKKEPELPAPVSPCNSVSALPLPEKEEVLFAPDTFTFD